MIKIFARILREAADIVLQVVRGFALFVAASDAMQKAWPIGAKLPKRLDAGRR